MKPVWAVQINGVSQVQANAVFAAVEAIGGKACKVEVLPSTGAINFVNDPDVDTTGIIPYGSTTLVELAMAKQWQGVFRNDNFSVPVWNENRDDMLNQNGVSMQAKDLPDYLASLHMDEVVFIRPTIGKKLFPGQIASVASIMSWLATNQVGKYKFPLDTEVTVASSRKILDETRWFVVNGKVIDGSTYRLHGQQVLIHDINEGNLKEAQKFADLWLPHPTCVMDLALTDEGLKVVEFNTFNSSGFYHHDIPKIISAVHAEMSETLSS